MMRYFELLFRKADAETRVSLPGAVFSLVSGGIKYTAVSDERGMVDFFPLQPGRYILTEVTAPDGYRLNTTQYPVSVNPCGRCCVNGQPANGFVFLNTAI